MAHERPPRVPRRIFTGGKRAPVSLKPLEAEALTPSACLIYYDGRLTCCLCRMLRGLTSFSSFERGCRAIAGREQIAERDREREEDV